MRHMRRAIATLLLASPRACDAACPANCPEGMYDKYPGDCNDGWAWGANCAGGKFQDQAANDEYEQKVAELLEQCKQDVVAISSTV